MHSCSDKASVPFPAFCSNRSMETVEDTSTPYYPIPTLSASHHITAMCSIREGYHHPVPQPVPMPPPSPPPPPSKPKENAMTRRNHVLPSAVNRKTNLNKVIKAPAKKPVPKHPEVPRLPPKKIPPSQFLTPLPPKTSYQSLLWVLNQASKSPPRPLTATRQYVTPATHTHATFHDHFALLSAEHVPEEFCGPITSLPVQLPREVLTRCLQRRVISREHNYASRASKHSLTLSLPRSLLNSHNCLCACDGEPLVYCPVCHSLYHSTCSNSCPGCINT